jgi:TonB-dependent SusC/RagA subfamily outer membrane receptor
LLPTFSLEEVYYQLPGGHVSSGGVVFGFKTEATMWRQKRIGTVIGGLALVALYGCGGGSPPPASSPDAEAVQVGYGTQDASSVTGSIGSLEMDGQAIQHSGRIEEVLQGRVAGLHVTRTPGGGYSLRIRGTNSLTGNNEPLLVVDGMIVSTHMTSTTLGSINPTDVQRVEVLKDAGSTAIYGSRGANGVIIITTKRGR